MKIALLSDIHGNAHALSECLNFIEKLNVSQIYSLGDTVGYYPDCREVLGLLHAANVVCQKGNHEDMLLHPEKIPSESAAAYKLDQAREALTEDLLDEISGWPEVRSFTLAGIPLQTQHGSPSDYLRGYVYPDTDLAQFDTSGVKIICMGHTHRPFVGVANGATFVNVGSVGLPRDHGTLAAFAVVDLAGPDVRIYRVKLSAEKIRSRYAGHVDNSVLKCLERATQNPVGVLLK